MSMAQNLPIYGSLAGSAAPRLAPEIPVSRPRARVATRKRAVGGPIVFATVIWLCAMALSVVVVWRNTIVQQETSAITRGRDQLAALNQQNRELQDQLVKATAATTVQDWALAHGMQRAVSFKSVPADPTAVAVQPGPAVPAEAKAAASPGLFGNIREMALRLLGLHQTAAGER